MAVLLSSEPITITPSQSELTNSRLTPQHLEIAIRALHQDGLVVIDNIIPHGLIDHLNPRMIQDALVLQSRKENSPYNYNPGNIQQDPPPSSEFFHPEIFLNPIVNQITSTHLGPNPKMTFMSANTALPDPTLSSQPVHSDADFAHPSHAFAVVVNVPLTTMTPANGSTEIWLGTHTAELSGPHAQEGVHGERASGRIKNEYLDTRRTVRPPSQPVVKKGSAIIRDLRLWHAGKPNTVLDGKGSPRVMLAMIHFAPWYRNGMVLEMGEDAREKIEGAREMLKEVGGLEVPMEYKATEEVLQTYMTRPFGNAYDFGQAD